MINKEKISHNTLVRLAEGDHAAFVEIYEAYHKGVYVFVNGYMRNTVVSEDVVHEVFLKLWEVRSRIDPDRSFIGYIYRIARNATYKELKKRMEYFPLDVAVDEECGYSAHASSEDIYRDKEYAVLLEGAVNALPPQRQKVFVLCRQQGKTYEEVANQLSISPYTVKEHMSLAMKSIQDYMGKNAGLSVSRTAFVCALYIGFVV